MKIGFRQLLWSAAFILIAGVACKPRQPLTGSVTGGAGSEILEKNRKANLEFHFLQIKGKADFEGEDEKSSFSFTYKIHIAKDSLIWISITKFGIEAIRMLASVDSVKVRRLDTHEATLCNYDMIQKATGMKLNYYHLQDLLLGEVNQSSKEMRFAESKKPPFLFKGVIKPYQVIWELGNPGMKLLSMNAGDAIINGSTIGTWSNFKEANGKLFAHSLSFIVLGRQKMNVGMEHSKVEIDNDKTSFNFNIPDSYEIKFCEAK